MLHIVVLDGLGFKGHKVGTEHGSGRINGGGKGSDDAGCRLEQEVASLEASSIHGAHYGEGHEGSTYRQATQQEGEA